MLQFAGVFDGVGVAGVSITRFTFQSDPPPGWGTWRHRVISVGELRDLRISAYTCTDCPLHEHREKCVWGRPYPVHGGVLIVGEAPGRMENEQGLPFIGKSGEVLTWALQAVGLTEDEVFITNTVKCWPGPDATGRGNATPPVSDQLVCITKYLQPVIEYMEPRLVIAVGAQACKALTGLNLSQAEGLVNPLKLATYVYKTNEKTGKTTRKRVVVDYPNTSVFTLRHPAWFMRNPQDKHLFDQQVSALDRTLNPPILVPTTYNIITIDDMVEDVAKWTHLVRELFSVKAHAAVAVDIETTGLSPRGDTILGVSLSTKKDTAWYISDPRLWEYLGEKMQHAPYKVVFHNAKFDLAFLEQQAGWHIPTRRVEDTMLMADALGLPKRGLKVLALSELGIQMERYETWDHADPTYPCRDADATLQLYEVFAPQLKTKETYS